MTEALPVLKAERERLLADLEADEESRAELLATVEGLNERILKAEILIEALDFVIDGQEGTVHDDPYDAAFATTTEPQAPKDVTF